MKVRYNKEVEVLIWQVAEGEVIESNEVHPGVILDFDSNDAFREPCTFIIQDKHQK